MVSLQATQKFLNKNEKQAIGLLSIGTFLEYFDLMLYVHMAVFLNEIFFPKTDPHTAALLSAFAFCSTFVFRPIGALIFGWLGDNIGRKSTVIVTTFMMAISCFIMANLPTYEQIGITAAWLLTLCRMVQGMSSMGEIIGAEIYLTEATKPPVQYPAVALIVTFSTIGTFAALLVASFVTSHGLNWRIAFWFGGGVALVGVIARTTLRETADFANAKLHLQKVFNNVSNLTLVDKKKLEHNVLLQTSVVKKTAIAYFLIECAWPVSFYFTYLYCSNILKNTFGYTAAQVIHHNLNVSIVNLVAYIILTYLSYKIYPLKILKFRLMVFWLLALVSPFIFFSIKSPLEILLIQSVFIIFRPDAFPAIPIYIKHFPIFKRFSYTSWLFALSRVSMHLITSFGLVYLVEYFDFFGMLMIMVPTSLGFAFGVNHFKQLEKAAGNYPENRLNMIQNPKVAL
ncbi:MAG: metabolite-proton [Caudoviricetes sp.]|nr:MAG: metabolite-proton [Caudoviricetes sp.]